VSIYEWPSDTERESRDDPFARQRFFAPKRQQLDLERALLAGRMTGPRGTRRARDRARRNGLFFSPATGPRNVWLPLGPASIIGGQAANKPRVAGRVRALAVHPDGERLYAAAANGGIWYSSDRGATWRSIGGLAATDASDITRPAHRHACGAILVRFDRTAPTNDESKDVVLVGTGETTPGTHARPGKKLGGIGVLTATGPATSTAADPWTEEAPNLAGHGVYRFASEPDGTRLVVATSIGLFERPAAAGQDVPWGRIATPPFDSFGGAVHDVIWTSGAGDRPKRLWVWSTGDAEQFGLWVLAEEEDPQVEAVFKKVDTPGSDVQRSVLAASEPPTRVYVLNNRHRRTGPTRLPGLYQIDSSVSGEPTANPVTAGVPDVLRHLGEHTMAMAVDPANANRVVIAGSYIGAKNPRGKDYENLNGSAMSAVVADNGGTLTFGHPAAPTMIGVGVHADVHDLRFSNAGARLWLSCDGGVFRSERPAQQVGFVACNDGLAIAEANYVASHPTCEGRVVLGLQDNGVIERDSNGVWRAVEEGDGGGVAFDPSDTRRYLSQYSQAAWQGSDGAFGSLLLRRYVAVPPHQANEDGDSAFYSTPAAIKHTRGANEVGQVLIGTDRVWYTEDWGAKFFTLPTGTDPIKPKTASTLATHDRKQDQLGESVTVCKWAGPDVAWILTQQRFESPGGKIVRLQRTAGSADAGGPGNWAKPPERLLAQSRKNKKDATKADGPIREAVAWTDLAVNPDAGGVQRGTKGAVYLGTTGHPDKPEVDTLWWFDGTSKWHKTGLRDEGVPAPVTAVLCDPANPDHVYVGTTVGVWRGTRTLAANNPPDWVWEPLVNGLPEAAVEDLSLFDSGGVRLLRAAIASRGVWEMAIDTDAATLTYLRAHDDDLRRRVPASELKRDGKPGRSWHGSPDVRPRPAPGPVTKPATLPWTKDSGDIVDETLWRFQMALRSKTNDPRCRPTARWDFYFEEVLRDNGAPQLANVCQIDDAFWDSVMKPPQVNAEPWGTAIPVEADLYELTPKLEEGELGIASANLITGKAKVDVVVHHRGINPIDGADVRVTLLHWIDPKSKKKAKPDDSKTWFSGDVPWTEAVNEVLNSSAGTTSKSFGAGWAFTLPAPNRRKTLAGQTLDPMRSGIVSFDINLAGAKADFVVLLVAIIRVGADIALGPDELRDLTLDNPNVAVRSLRVIK
jgi:hypothetical protein